MIYIISGASRSGKTIIAKETLEMYKIPYLSTDYLMMGFMHGVKEMEIHDKLWPDEIAQKLWRFLEPFIETMIYNDENYVLEGEAFLPELLKPLLDRHPNKIKICFIGYKDADTDKKVLNIKKYVDHNDWLVKLGDTEIVSHVNNMIQYSNYLFEETKKYHMSYFDTSDSFTDSIEECIEFLITK
jgi:2-phosphoglycerate kinase